MKKIYYSPNALEKMQKIKTSLSLEYGERTANKSVSVHVLNMGLIDNSPTMKCTPNSGVVRTRFI